MGGLGKAQGQHHIRGLGPAYLIDTDDAYMSEELAESLIFGGRGLQLGPQPGTVVGGEGHDSQDV